MVLAELGQRISQALGSLNSVTVVDEAVRPLPYWNAACSATSLLLRRAAWTACCGYACAPLRCAACTLRRCLLRCLLCLWARQAPLAAAALARCRTSFKPLPAVPAALPPAKQVLDGVLKEIATALLQADVNVRLVANLR